MLEFEAAQFYWAVNAIDSIRSHYGERGLISGRKQADGSIVVSAIDPVAISMLHTMIGNLRSSLKELGAEVTLLIVDELEDEVVSNLPTYEGVRRIVDQIDATLRRELKTVRLIVVERHDRDLYEQSGPAFGANFAGGFGSAEFDVEEAGKCLALGRSTASAYHSLRVLEAAVYALSRCLGLPDPIKGADRTWGKMLGLVRDSLEARWPARGGRMAGDARVFDEIYGALAGMQNPYRNSTMHLASKYTPEEARHIYDLVKGLMKRVAARMDEQGNPKA